MTAATQHKEYFEVVERIGGIEYDFVVHYGEDDETYADAMEFVRDSKMAAQWEPETVELFEYSHSHPLEDGVCTCRQFDQSHKPFWSSKS